MSEESVGLPTLYNNYNIKTSNITALSGLKCQVCYKPGLARYTGTTL
jgi:hypothetical protein